MGCCMSADSFITIGVQTGMSDLSWWLKQTLVAFSLSSWELRACCMRVELSDNLKACFYTEVRHSLSACVSNLFFSKGLLWYQKQRFITLLATGLKTSTVHIITGCKWRSFSDLCMIMACVCSVHWWYFYVTNRFCFCILCCIVFKLVS